MVSPMNSPLGSGPFSKWIGQQLLAQRFATRQEAAGALEMALEMSHRSCKPLDLQWSRQSAGAWSSEYDGDVIHAKRMNGIWRVVALSPEAHQAMLRAAELERNPEQNNADVSERVALEMTVKRNLCYLGSARTLATVKMLAGEELAWNIQE